MRARPVPAACPNFRRWLLVPVRLALAAVFIAASADKIVHPDRFADVVWDYQVLPMGLINLFAICLPWVELATAACLIAGVWLDAAGLLAAAMSLMFMVALGAALARGQDTMHCGCFSTAQEGVGDSLWGLLGRDIVVFAATVWLVREAFRDAASGTAASLAGE